MDNFEKSGRKITLALLVSQSLFSASMIMAFTVGSIIILQMTDNDSRWTGVPTTLNLVGAAMMAYPMGWLMGRIGRRRGLSIGYVFGISGAALAGLAVVQGLLWLFLAGIVLMGFTRGIVEQGRYAAAEANLAHRRARAISLVVLGGTVGSIGGPVLIEQTSNLAQNLGLPHLSGPWFAAGFFFLVSLAIINMFLRPDPQQIARQLEARFQSEPAAGPSRGGRAPLGELIRNPNVKLAMGTMIVGQLVMVFVMAITPVHMHLAHHEISAISVVIMAHTLGMFGLSFVTGWLVDRFGSARMIVAGALILISACLVAPLSTAVPWLALGLFLLGLGWNLCYVAGSSLLAGSLRPREQTQIQGVNDTLISFTSAMGSLSSGLVFAAVGFTLMNWFALLLALIPIALVILLRTASRELLFPQEGKGTVSN